MSNSAKVTSLEQLVYFLEHSREFRSQLLSEIENLEVELRRVTAWLEQEAHAYWSQELLLARRRVAESEQALTRCLSYVRESERRPCTDEKKRHLRAQTRLGTCEQKLKVARAASTAWQQELSKNSTKIQRCRDLADADLAVAINHLVRQIERLEAYANLKSPALSKSRTDATASDSTVATPPTRETGPAKPSVAVQQQKEGGERTGTSKSNSLSNETNQ